MKRRRGSKKGNAKKARTTGTSEEGTSNNGSMNTDTNSGTEECDNNGVDSGVEVETPASTATDQPEKIVTASTGGIREKPAGLAVYGRMKVKIKTSKTLDCRLTSSEAATQSDNDRSSQQPGPEKQVVDNGRSSQHPGPEKQVVDSDRSSQQPVPEKEIVDNDRSSQQPVPEKQAVANEKMEDSDSLADANLSTLGNELKKSGGIKFKPSRGFSSSTSPCSNAEMMKEDKTKTQEPELPRRDVKFNKQELDTALEVIRKIMKMDAAEPFNVPVDPIALGIPDYFDVIDTPMDFGTICSNLENGVKYMNSEDVYKDVQYIWNNCYKYNNKGDYVMDLMKRVKKNFSKYWTAAGLYSDHLQSAESSQFMDTTPSSQVKDSTKGGSVSNKNRKFQGLKKHKEGCLCAICVMIRRRQEREESNRLLDDQDGSDPEGTSPVGSREYTSSNMENSPDTKVDTNPLENGADRKLTKYQDALHGKLEEVESEMGIQSKRAGVVYLQSSYVSGDEHRAHHQKQNLEPSGDMLNNTRNENLLHGYENAAAGQQRPTELQDKYQKAKMLENLRYLENPEVMELSRILFADNQRSVWNGPHSLAKREGSTRKSSIRAAISMLMKSQM